MKRTTMKRVLLFFLSILLSDVAFSQKKFVIDPCSRFSIKGKTNISQFSCDFSGHKLARETLAITWHEVERNRFITEGAMIELSVEHFDCGILGMNKDFRRLLDASHYPIIHVKLAEICIDDLAKAPNRTYETTSQVEVIIREVSNTYSLTGQSTLLHPEEHIYFTGSLDIQLTDFGLVPPTKAFDLIRVKDELIIALDLLVIGHGSSEAIRPKPMCRGFI